MPPVSRPGTCTGDGCKLGYTLSRGDISVVLALHTCQFLHNTHARTHTHTHSRTHALTHAHTIPSLPLTHEGGAEGEFDVILLKDFHIFWKPPLRACTCSLRAFCTELRAGMRVCRVRSITNLFSPSWSSALKNCPNPTELGGRSAPEERPSRQRCTGRHMH